MKTSTKDDGLGMGTEVTCPWACDHDEAGPGDCIPAAEAFAVRGSRAPGAAGIYGASRRRARSDPGFLCRGVARSERELRSCSGDEARNVRIPGIRALRAAEDRRPPS